MPTRPHPAQPRVWERFVAIGDSFTEGMVDVDPEREGEYVGWADRVAAGLAARNELEGRPFGYANLAIRGRLIDAIIAEQLEAALTLKPDLVSFSAGGNDVLRPRVSIDHVLGKLEVGVERIRETGADVLLVTAPNVAWASLVNRVHPRMVEYTAELWGVAQRTGSFVVDLYTMQSLRDARMWGEDRIHFTSAGHARIAAQALWTLGMPFEVRDWLDPLEAPAPLGRFESLAADRDWVAAHLRPWIHRRLHGESSGDHRLPKRPEILPVAARQVPQSTLPEQSSDASQGPPLLEADVHHQQSPH
ncbi:MAG: SGNH/GDSL hydrolase family protein [Ornithinimicrobium sp.]|uniref:SGNH/GDSL hydrolase family protein n=1 Tax=Ornithinimicrobium sp. TaxID=1977084 RepID=UPI0026E06718|nr:SGNH/GDSL hydrolase family protein [Ornithinimicrobium sp.]MDO5740311.1 SGNH/GDSL hydrolase family protein [Ornithinimicrobium sp.]